MQSLKLIYEENDPVFPALIKEALEATGKFVVLLEKEEFQNNFKKNEKKESTTNPRLFGNFLLDSRIRMLQWKEEAPQKISLLENKILRLLLENAGNVVARSYILSSFWGEQSFYTSRSLDIIIYHLRKMLKKDPSVMIQTIRGEGFLLRY
ncbi:MAG: winged helix-turn-helix domain-containing protein [Candidatus Azobacteroides sp.]|nr:winged helix-turn-helix domain-containing protein [Candidatus Azobacteroides sp.]